MLSDEELNRALGNTEMSGSSAKVRAVLSDLRDLRRRQDELSKELSVATTAYLHECREVLEEAMGCKFPVHIDEERCTLSVFIEGGGELRMKPVFSSNLWDFSGTLSEAFEERYGSIKSVDQDHKLLAEDLADFFEGLRR